MGSCQSSSSTSKYPIVKLIEVEDCIHFFRRPTTITNHEIYNKLRISIQLRIHQSNQEGKQDDAKRDEILLLGSKQGVSLDPWERVSIFLPRTLATQDDNDYVFFCSDENSERADLCVQCTTTTNLPENLKHEIQLQTCHIRRYVNFTF